MRERFGDKLYGRYGFADAFHPKTGWFGEDVIGINVGIGLLMAENLRTAWICVGILYEEPGNRPCHAGGCIPPGSGR